MNKNQIIYNENLSEKEENINLREILERYLYYWPWYLVGLVIALSIAFLYLRYTQPEYQVQTKILLLDEDSSLSGEMAALQDMTGMGGGKTNVEDQVEVIKSRRLLMEVAKELKLNIRYFTEGRVKRSELLPDESPFHLILSNELGEDTDSLKANFKFELIGENKFEIYDEESGFKVKSEFGKKLQTPIGEVTFVPNISKNLKSGNEFFISVNPIMKV